MSAWFSEWPTPTEKGFYFVQGQLWMSGAVEMRICKVMPPARSDQGHSYVMSGAFLYKHEQPPDLLWWGPIPEPPAVPREAKIYDRRPT